MIFVTIVPVVHEQHHQRTGEDEQIRQQSEHMCSMFGEQEESGDGTKT